MKKMMVVTIGMVVLLAMASIGYGADVWPPQRSGLITSLSSTQSSPTSYCALYNLGAGTTGVACKTSVITAVKCTPDGAKQKCSNGAILYQFDSPATKCRKVCAPACTIWK